MPCPIHVFSAFNSWDRLPYITTVRNGTASTIPAFNEAHHNFIVANYAADGGCLDNDDGSSYYREGLDTILTRNLLVVVVGGEWWVVGSGRCGWWSWWSW